MHSEAVQTFWYIPKKQQQSNIEINQFNQIGFKVQKIGVGGSKEKMS